MPAAAVAVGLLELQLQQRPSELILGASTLEVGGLLASGKQLGDLALSKEWEAVSSVVALQLLIAVLLLWLRGEVVLSLPV